MGFRFRKRPRVGPFRVNVTERGIRSVSIKVGPFTWNPKRRKVTTNLPGGLYHEHTYDVAVYGCACGHQALMHDADTQDCARCPCSRYRRTRT